MLDTPTKFTDHVYAGQLKTLQCETDSSNPKATIKWYKLNKSGTYDLVTTGVTDAELAGNNGGKTTKSEIKISTTKALNGVKYKCESTYSRTGQKGIVFSKEVALKVECEHKNYRNIALNKCYG
jgi:hypothetical protein